MFLSDFLKNGTTLQSAAGPSAIAVNDLLEIAASGQLYPVKVSDYAAVGNQAGVVIPATAVSSFGMTNSSLRNATAVAPDGSLLVMDTYITNPTGMRVSKYLPSGALSKVLILDTTATNTMEIPTILPLTNGNYVCVWNSTIAGVISFAIVDQFLNPVVVKTAVNGITGGGIWGATALVGGGFAVTGQAGAQPGIAIYTNAGAVTLAGSALTNGAVFGNTSSVHTAPVQLSNGNIAIGCACIVAAKHIGYAIVTAAGINVVACTLLDTTAGASIVDDIVISALNGFFAIGGTQSRNRQTVYVLSNAGVLQGGVYLDTQAVTPTNVKLLNDGTRFWFIYQHATATLMVVASIPTSGTGFLTSQVTVGASGTFDAFYEKGFIVLANGSIAPNLFTLTVSATGFVDVIQSFTGPTLSNPGIAPAGDFAVSILNVATLSVYKYLNTAIAGVSQQTLAAGNAGSVLSFAMGPGGYTINPIVGTVGKAFDHSATTIAGNKGTMLTNGVSLKGI